MPRLGCAWAGLCREMTIFPLIESVLHRGGRQVPGRIARTARNIEIATHQPRLSARPWKCRSAALPQQNPNSARPAVTVRRDGPPYCPPTPRAVQLESARRQLLARSQHAADRLFTARVLAARDGAGAQFRPVGGAAPSAALCEATASADRSTARLGVITAGQRRAFARK